MKSSQNNELRWSDAIDLADHIKNGDFSAREVIEAAIRRVEAGNSSLNAVITETFEKSLVSLPISSERPFHGVPLLIKDLGVAVDGTFYSAGNRALKEARYRSIGDSLIIKRLREAGFVLLGKTNSPELGTLPTTEPLAWGPSRNPYNLHLSPGGSSGGSAAAVAAGFTPVAHASDGGGSIRVPASSCGLVGLKPSRGRITLSPHAGEAWAGCVTDGVVSRSVRDTAAVLDILSVPAVGDPYHAPFPERSFLSIMSDLPPRLKIALAWEEPRIGLRPTPECIEAVKYAGNLLESLGHYVELERPKAWDATLVHGAFSRIVSVCVAREIEGIGKLLGRELRENDVEPLNWVLAARGRETAAKDYLSCVDELHAFSRLYASFFSGPNGFDILVTPTMATPPPALGSMVGTAEDPLLGFRKSVPLIAYTSPINISGQPGISLPLFTTSEGIPIGVQLISSYGQEALLLRLANELAMIAPWNDRHPKEFL